MLDIAPVRNCSERLAVIDAPVTPLMSRKRTRPHARPDALAYTVDEVRQLGGPGRTKLYELVKRGELRSITIGRRRLICGDALRTLLRGAG